MNLYQLPKDVLVQLVYKNFNNLSMKDVKKLYQYKYNREMEKYKQILKKQYLIDDICVTYRKGVLYIEKLDSTFEIHIFHRCIYDRKNPTRFFSSLELLFDELKKFLNHDIIKLIELLIKTYYEKLRFKEINKYVKNV